RQRGVGPVGPPPLASPVELAFATKVHVEIQQTANHSTLVVFGFDPAPSRGPEPSPLDRVLEEAVDGGPEGRRASWRDQQPRTSLVQHRWDVSHRRGHDGVSRGHRLEQRQGEAFRMGREAEDARPGQELGHPVVRQGPGELDLGKTAVPVRRSDPFERPWAFLRTIPHHGHLEWERFGFRRGSSSEEGIAEIDQSLAFSDRSYEQQHWWALVL